MEPQLLRTLVLAIALLTACAPATVDDGGVPSAERDGEALDTAYATELWAPAELAANAIYTPLRLVTQDPDLATARLVVTADRDVGRLTQSASARSSEVDGWFYGKRGPGFSLAVEDALDEATFGPLTFSVRRADDPEVVVASATTHLVPATHELSADACLGGGNVVVWERVGSFGGAFGPMLESALAGSFDATVREVDYVGDTFREVGLRIDAGSFALRTPRGAEPPAPLVLGELVQGEVKVPGGCSDSAGDFIVFDLQEGERFSPLRARAARLTVAWRASCGGSRPVELRGCAHFDADAPLLR